MEMHVFKRVVPAITHDLQPSVRPKEPARLLPGHLERAVIYQPMPASNQGVCRAPNTCGLAEPYTSGRKQELQAVVGCMQTVPFPKFGESDPDFKGNKWIRAQ
jgi:hypothetical protein